MSQPYPNTPSNAQLLTFALKAACEACGVIPEEIGRLSNESHAVKGGNLRRDAASVTARMVFAMLTYERLPGTTGIEWVASFAPGINPDSLYGHRRRGLAKLERNELVEVNPPPATATEEKVLEPVKQVLARAIADYASRVTAFQAMSEARKARRPA